MSQHRPSPDEPHQGPLLERREALDAIEELLAGASRGDGRTLFLIGEAGLGKTALLGEAVRRAAAFRVGRAAGEAAESVLPFGFLAQAVAEAGARAPLRPRPGLAPPERWAAVFVAVQAWLSRSSPRPTLLALDDCHWADPDSLQLLAALARRLSSHPVAVVATLRPWPSAAAEVARSLVAAGAARIERLAPLSSAGAAALLAELVGEAAAGTRTRLVELSAGNPLLLCQLAEVAAGQPDPPLSSIASELGERLLLSRFTGVGPMALDYARTAAVFGVRFRLAAVPEVAGLDAAAARQVLEDLGRSRLVQGGAGGWAEFVHPLLREVLYADLPQPLRAHLHGLAFRALRALGAPAGEAAEHASAAGLLGDADAVRTLHRAGLDALAQGALAGATDRLRAAARLAGDGVGTPLLLDLAEVLPLVGAHDEAGTVCRTVVDRDGVATADRARALHLLGRCLFQAGAVGAAEDAYQRAADVLGPADPAGAAALLAEAAATAVYLRGPRRAHALAERAAALVADGAPAAVAAQVEAVRGHTAVLLGDGDAAGRQEAATKTADSGPGAGPDGSWGFGPRLHQIQTAKTLERFEAAEACYQAAMAAAERSGNPLAVAVFGVAHADTLVRRGRLAEALELLRRARWVGELMPGRSHWAAAGLAHLHCELDEPEAADRWCRGVELAVGSRAGDLPILRLWLLTVRARLALEAGDVETAAGLGDAAAAVAQDSLVLEPCVVPWAAVALAADAAHGRFDAVEGRVSSLEAAAGRLPCRWPRGVAALGRAWLSERAGDRAGAEARFEEAVAHQVAAGMPLAEVEALCAAAAFLRRSGRRVRARAVATRALRQAEALGARRLARHAHAELRAAGGRRRGGTPADALTAQEAQVAAFAADGLTNDEIGRRLFISGRTVEHHLGQVYAKLEVRSRRELRRRPPTTAGQADGGAREPSPMGSAGSIS